MEIISFTFAAFFCLFCAAVWWVPPARRWVVVLAGSALFVAVASPVALGVVAAVSVVAYRLGRAIEAAATPAARRWRLGVGVGLLVGLLLAARARAILGGGSSFGVLGNVSGALWGLGLSFYGLKAIGYLLDVYHERVAAERSLGRLAAYLSLFLEMLAGPIDRPGNLLQQLREPGEIDSSRVREGLRLVLWGWMKKALVGDRLAPFVALVFAAPGGQGDVVLVVAVVAFAAQLYFDFSGYSDMAVGMGRVVGLSLPENFRQPYFAQSISDFWRRWHVSLSSWLRDYCFLPAYYSLARRIERTSLASTWVDRLAFSAAALGTMALAGAWHGLQLNYLSWGLWFGLTMAGSVLLSGPRKRLVRLARLRSLPRLHGALRSVATLAIVLVGWVLLRAGSFADALHILAAPIRLLAGTPAVSGAGAASTSVWAAERVSVIMALGITGGMLVVDWASHHGREPGVWFARCPVWVRWGAYYAALGALLFLSRSGSGGFIYAGF